MKGLMCSTGRLGKRVGMRVIVGDCVGGIYSIFMSTIGLLLVSRDKVGLYDSGCSQGL